MEDGPGANGIFGRLQIVAHLAREELAGPAEVIEAFGEGDATPQAPRFPDIEPWSEAQLLTAEKETLGDRIRAVIITDFEKASSTTATVENVLDEEAGGAIAAFKTVLRDPATDQLNPVLLEEPISFRL